MDRSMLRSFITLVAFQCLLVGTVLSQTVGNGQDINLGPDPSFKCPNESGIFPHPTLCDQFYNCWVNVTTTRWQCGKWDGVQLAFNLDYNGCDFMENVDCEDRIPPGQVFTCPSSNGQYPITSTSCGSNYYNCVNNVPTVQTCPNKYIFDPRTSSCTAPGTESCQVRTTTRKPDPPTQPNGDFSCIGKPEGNYVSPYTCQQFYMCYEETTFLFECPSGLYYDASRDLCDYAVLYPPTCSSASGK